MVLPFKTFEQLIKKYIDQLKAEEEIVSGIAKYNADYGPYLEMPLTSSLPKIISDLYEDNNDYPAFDWWIYEGKLNKEKLENPEAKIWYTDNSKPDKIILTIKDLWEYMEEEYKERKCQKSS